MPGGAYTVAITLTTPPTNAAVPGTVTGSVNVNGGSGSGTSPSGKVRKLAVTAEAIGTNTPIATAPVKNGQYTLILPAASAPGSERSMTSRWLAEQILTPHNGCCRYTRAPIDTS